MPFSSGGSRAISATRTTNPYPASRPSTSPAAVIRAPVVVGRGVLCHHRAITATAPRPMRDSTRTGSTSRAIPRPGLSGRAPAAGGGGGGGPTGPVVRGAVRCVGIGPDGCGAAGIGPVGVGPVRIGPDRRGDRRPGWKDCAGWAGQAGVTGGSGPDGCSGHVPDRPPEYRLSGYATALPPGPARKETSRSARTPGRRDVRSLTSLHTGPPPERFAVRRSRNPLLRSRRRRPLCGRAGDRQRADAQLAVVPGPDPRGGDRDHDPLVHHLLEERRALVSRTTRPSGVRPYHIATRSGNPPARWSRPSPSATAGGTTPPRHRSSVSARWLTPMARMLPAFSTSG